MRSVEQQTILIVGAGQAGGTAAATLRSEGYAGRILLVGAEKYLPYERPPLSKGMLNGSQSDDSIFLQKAEFYKESKIEWKPNTDVEKICSLNKIAVLSDGSSIRFNQCLIATGGRARKFGSIPENTPNVYYLRTLSDVEAIREKLRPDGSVIVIGAGFLGLEFASTVKAAGMKVTVLEAGDQIMGRAVPALFATWLNERFAEAGIEVVQGAKIKAVAYGANGGHVEYMDGRILKSDICLIAIGQLPNIELAQSAGLTIADGIVVDAKGRTSSSGIFAAGDCASHFNDFLGKHTRLESWRNAQEQANVAAKSMLGIEAHYNEIPWFWSDQLGFNIQMLGFPEPQLRYVIRGDVKENRFIILGLLGEKVRYALTVNRGGEMRPLRAILASDAPVDVDALLDTSIPLKTIASRCIDQPVH